VEVEEVKNKKNAGKKRRNTAKRDEAAVAFP
jgi:hypothetical protein